MHPTAIEVKTYNLAVINLIATIVTSSFAIRGLAWIKAYFDNRFKKRIAPYFAAPHVTYLDVGPVGRRARNWPTGFLEQKDGSALPLYDRRDSHP